MITIVAYSFAFATIFVGSILKLPAESRLRVPSVVTLAWVAYKIEQATAASSCSKGWDLLITATLWTVFCHAVELLLCSRVTVQDVESMSIDEKRMQGSESEDSRRSMSTTVRILGALSLLWNWRRLGTKWEIKRVPKFADGGSVPSRGRFVLQGLFTILGCYIVMTLSASGPPPDAHMLEQSKVYFFSRISQVSAEEVIFRIASTVAFLLNASLMVIMFYYTISVTAVILGIASPADCPPMLGKKREAYTLRGFWRNYHQGLQKCLVGPAEWVTNDLLHLSRNSALSSFTRCLVAFIISGVIHYRSDVVINIPKSEAGQFIFFTIQAGGIMAEALFQELAKRFPEAISLPPLALRRTMGYLWVFIWFVWVTPIWSFPVMRVIDAHRDGVVSPIFAPIFAHLLENTKA